jgi:transposase-like protein
METITAELIDTGAKRDGRGRRLAVRREREAVIAAYERSGMTQREFAQREGIKFFTFTGWLKRYRTRSPVPAFAQVKVARRAASTGLEVALPNGVIVRGGEVEQIAALVQRLSGC